MVKIKQVVIVIGGSSGIGFETALKYAKNDYIVIIVSKNKENLDSAFEKISKHSNYVFKFYADVSNKGEVENVFESIYEKYKRIDVLVNSAGIMPLSFIRENKIEDWENTINVNLKGVINTTTAVLTYMKKNNEGHIVNIGSIFSYTTEPYGVMYSVSKHGIKAFTEGLRKELKIEKSNIFVTLISPGPVKTNLVKDVKFKVDMLMPESIADVIFTLTSDSSFKNITEVIIRP